MLKNSQKLCIKNLNRLKDQHFAPVSSNLKCLLIARVEEVGLRSLKIRHNKQWFEENWKGIDIVGGAVHGLIRW